MNQVVRSWLVYASASVALLSTGCSQSNQTTTASDSVQAKTETSAPAEPVSAKTAFWPMYTSARQWSTDFVLLSVKPKDIPGATAADGKAPVWEATFASPSKQAYRVFTYAIAAYPPDVYKGVGIGNVMPWSGSTRDVMPIPTSDFQVDSDAAYRAALADASPWLKKNPDKKLTTFQLGYAYKFPVPVWYLLWGSKKAGYSVIVNATNGKILKG